MVSQLELHCWRLLPVPGQQLRSQVRPLQARKHLLLLLCNCLHQILLDWRLAAAAVAVIGHQVAEWSSGLLWGQQSAVGEMMGSAEGWNWQQEGEMGLESEWAVRAGQDLTKVEMQHPAACWLQGAMLT